MSRLTVARFCVPPHNGNDVEFAFVFRLFKTVPTAVSRLEHKVIVSAINMSFSFILRVLSNAVGINNSRAFRGS